MRHFVLLLPSCLAVEMAGLTPMQAPTKGKMQALEGDRWELLVDPSAAESLGFLPEIPKTSPKREELKSEVLKSYQYMKDFDRHRSMMLAGGFYTSGKGFQKVAVVCLLLEEFYGLESNLTEDCTAWLLNAFRCYYDPEADSQSCQNAPASYYDEDWGGIVERGGWNKADCNVDYGNACFNDHHYHFGYFVVSAAILAKLQPSILENQMFVSYVDTLVRNTANPSSEDPYFPQFRTFDWFDLHSWSHGIVPSHDGKDQESTSEELNLLYGLTLWGRMTENWALQRLGATMLTLAAHTVREIFLMKDGNHFHPAGFVKNRVTGIFLQGKVDYTTWFGSKPEHIHGIQMLPLSPALQLTRTRSFCQQEWDSILSEVDLDSMTKAWASVLLTGSIAILDPDRAFEKLKEINEADLDGGLSRAWALYWASSEPGKPLPNFTAEKSAQSSLLGLVSSAAPDKRLFPRKQGHPVYPPVHEIVTGPKATNKFWANWLVKEGMDFPIFAMPYRLSWKQQKLQISAGGDLNEVFEASNPDRIKTYTMVSIEDFFLSAHELPQAVPAVRDQGLFGAQAELQDGEAILTFPIFSGMAYVTGCYSGGLTPEVSHPHGLERRKIRQGIWSFKNRRGIEYRVYVLEKDGTFADADFDALGQLNRQLNGYVRLAQVLAPGDVEVLDRHAQAVLVGWKLEVNGNGTVSYNFEKAGAQNVRLLHWAYGHHLPLVSNTSELANHPLV
mmetsp:Transcript_16284/g.28455  ORF Transcript_16284/g.28455 Transcript_16284/m.28455 type:complete len:729 (-) Transcript_16284:646-2832(-)